MGKFRLMSVLRIVLMPVLVWAIYLLKGNLWFRLYPAIMVALFFLCFFISLFKTPLVEVIARRMGEDIDDRAQRYCRNVTRVWAAFLAVHFLVTLATVFASYETWVFYNGVLAYIMMGVLFMGEWIVRRRVRRG